MVPIKTEIKSELEPDSKKRKLEPHLSDMQSIKKLKVEEPFIGNEDVHMQSVVAEDFMSGDLLSLSHEQAFQLLTQEQALVDTNNNHTQVSIQSRYFFFLHFFFIKNEFISLSIDFQ